MQPQNAPALAQPLTLSHGLFLITEDSMGVADFVAVSLQQQGVIPVILKSDTLLNPKQLAQEFEQLCQTHGPVTGILHLAALAPLAIPESLTQWRTYTAIHAKSLFQLLHLCSIDPNCCQHLCYVLSASLLGGYFGRQGDRLQGLATGGAGLGLLKTLVLEQPDIHVKGIDFDPSLSQTEIARLLVQELLSSDGRIEVGYPHGDRTIFKTVPAPITSEAPVWLDPQSDWVVLVTGGARGITAETISTLASFKLKLVIVGRSDYAETEDPRIQGIEDIPSLRKVLLQQAIAEGFSPTPVQIEQQIKQIRRDRDIRSNLARFRQQGATVEYISSDVKNPIELNNLVTEIYSRYGRLDGVIHGAGIIEDKLIIDKTLDSFGQVFDTKVDSTFLLSQCLRADSLKFFVLFSSVAGRYGNKGQSDYAAANEVINRLAWQLSQQWLQTRVLAINWGPWDTTGMATEEVKRKFREQGVIPIPLEAGSQFFLEELQRGDREHCEVIAGTGPWEKHEQEIARRNQLPALAFIGNSTPELQADGTVVLEHTFAVEREPYLADHCLDGRPVVPAAVALEWLAELIQTAWPEWRVAQIRNFRVLRGIVLNQSEGCLVRLQARASTHGDAEGLTATAEILDPVRQIPYYRATAWLQPELSPSPLVEHLEPILENPLEPSEAYQNYLFHGKRFQLITAIGGANSRGIDAQIQPSSLVTWLQRKSSAGSWLFDPGMIDTVPQLAIIWTRIQLNTTALPSNFGCVTRYSASLSPKPLRVAFRVQQANEHSLTYDAVLFDAKGNIHFQLEGMEGTCNSQLNRLAKSSGISI
ncbi:MAG: SDR family NAD(P)-dependent oxidoreductase [Microcoleaceae cyanobacterium]